MTTSEARHGARTRTPVYTGKRRVPGLYERTLARKPKAEELAVCKKYLQKVGNRNEALEDVFWSLVNSTEFLTKR